jgi:hypothetical protein
MAAHACECLLIKRIIGRKRIVNDNEETVIKEQISSEERPMRVFAAWSQAANTRIGHEMGVLTAGLVPR